MERVRWGIIGCGNVTEVKSGPGLQKAHNSELVAVMRRDGDKAADYARRHGVPRWTNDADTLIHDPEVDVVYIATPPDSHLEYTRRVAAAGKPVYVEKPMARTHPEAQEMIDHCARAGVPLWVAYYRRTLPKFRKIRELVDGGRIGEPRGVTVQLRQPLRPEDPAEALPWRVIPEIAGGGLFFDLASHMLDFLDYLLGPVVQVDGIAANQAGRYPAEDIVGSAFQFESGVVGTGLWHFSAFSRQEWTEIEGTQGRIGYVTFDNSPIQLTTANGVEEIQTEQPEHVQQPLIQSIVDEILGGDRSPSNGESGARTSWVMDQIVESYRAQTSAQ